ncbi:hypothetical protein B0H10DRAFT_2202844 [Mycena sp. CBHHK59/15]|nr:hypothetical protein B0H10DRAFT_2202844 [Mycena sp. CBHHK59/15]
MVNVSSDRRGSGCPNRTVLRQALTIDQRVPNSPREVHEEQARRVSSQLQSHPTSKEGIHKAAITSKRARRASTKPQSHPSSFNREPPTKRARRVSTRPQSHPSERGGRPQGRNHIQASEEGVRKAAITSKLCNREPPTNISIGDATLFSRPFSISSLDCTKDVSIGRARAGLKQCEYMRVVEKEHVRCGVICPQLAKSLAATDGHHWLPAAVGGR